MSLQVKLWVPKSGCTGCDAAKLAISSAVNEANQNSILAIRKIRSQKLEISRLNKVKEDLKVKLIKSIDEIREGKLTISEQLLDIGVLNDLLTLHDDDIHIETSMTNSLISELEELQGKSFDLAMHVGILLNVNVGSIIDDNPVTLAIDELKKELNR